MTSSNLKLKLSFNYLLIAMIIALVAVLVSVTSVFATGSKAIPLRGIVEGFYGVPWTQQQRLDMLDFMAGKKMNAYIYGPKDDEYHRKYWRQPYPEDKLQDLQQLINRAKADNIEFIFAVSPGNDIDFASAKDKAAMVNKMTAMYKMGVRQFALFFDDIPTKDAKGQAEFINYINRNFVKKHKDCKRLIVVPTEYYLLAMENQGNVQEYTAAFAGNLDKDILVLYTGAEVCPDGLTEETISRVNEIYGRAAGLWWNYPVNDYMEQKLALGPLDSITAEADGTDIPAFFVNPMFKPELSKIAIATAADYALAPAEFNASEAWQKALQEQYGKLAQAMEVFADHSQRLENNWAHIGHGDAARLREMYYNYWRAQANHSQEAAAIRQRLLEDNANRSQMVQMLQEMLKPEVKAECQEQLELLQLYTGQERIGLYIMDNEPDRDEAYRLLRAMADKQKAIEAKQQTAKISEGVLDGFYADFLKWFHDKYQ